jgi:hypothetical protein
MTSNPNVVWSDATLKPTLEPKFDNVDIPFFAKNDLVLCFERYQSFIELGGVLEVVVKRKLSWSAYYQAEAEFYIWTKLSYFPFV